MLDLAIVKALLHALNRPAPRGLKDLGGTWDIEVLDALSAVTADPADLARVSDQLTPDQKWALLGWAEGACTWAVRCRSTDLIQRVVQALSLLDGQLDRRDILVVATLAHRAARRLGVTLEELSDSDQLPTGPPPPAWVLGASEDLPSSYVERGEGSSFEFRREPSGFDPAALEELLNNDQQ